MNFTRTRRIGILLAVALAVATVLAIVPRFPQPAEYSLFADSRTMFGVPNALNVLSNLAFLVVGLWSMWFVTSHGEAFIEPIERLPYLIFFFGVVLTCFGSAWFHLAPGNDRLVWDRVPMTVGFMALLAAILGERLGPRFGVRALPFLLLLGVGSVVYWIASEHAGRGDLRPYAFVQFFPLLAIPLLIALFPARYTRTSDLAYVVGFYILAKVLESYDAMVFRATANTVSGHTLKHLAAATAVWFVLLMLQKRQPV